MQLKCQSCGHELHSRDVDFESLRAMCRHCGWQLGGAAQSAYRTGAATDAALTEEVEEAPTPSRPMPWLPGYITISEWGREDDPFLEVNIRPRQWWAVFIPIPMLIAFGALAWLSPIVPALILSVVAPAGAYAIAAYLGNKRHIHVAEGRLSVFSTPLPWFRRAIPVQDLQQLWVDEVTDKNHRVMYRLRARLARGDIVLVDFLEDASAALHLERRIEEMLGIADVPVPGEIEAPR